MKFLYLNVVVFASMVLVSCSPHMTSEQETSRASRFTLIDISKSSHTSIVVSDSVSVDSHLNNPFGSTDCIKFTLAEDAQVRIQLYDFQGNLRLIWADQDLPAGAYEADFSGLSFGPNIYFAKLFVNGDVASIKQILLSR